MNFERISISILNADNNKCERFVQYIISVHIASEFYLKSQRDMTEDNNIRFITLVQNRQHGKARLGICGCATFRLTIYHDLLSIQCMALSKRR